MKKLALLIIVAGIAAFAYVYHAPPSVRVDAPADAVLSTSDRALQTAFENRQHDFQVGGSGTVVKVLPDDTEGRRHQRFVLRLASGQTLLIAHNIDIAPRIVNLRVGDHVNFYGEYEWNENGGVVHWTHHDPGGRHEDGWVNHGGKLYD